MCLGLVDKVIISQRLDNVTSEVFSTLNDSVIFFILFDPIGSFSC